MFPVQHLFRVEIPPRVAVEVLDPQTLPARWAAISAPLDATAPLTPLQALGDAWWTSRRAVAWMVPSALVPEEPNVLLHPDHPDWRRLKIEAVRAFRFDPRLSAKR
jgi:RES domain-containing protein